MFLQVSVISIWRYVLDKCGKILARKCVERFICNYIQFMFKPFDFHVNCRFPLLFLLKLFVKKLMSSLFF